MGPTAQYWLAVVALLIPGVLGCIAVRRAPERYATVVGRLISVVLLTDAVTYVVDLGVRGGWTPRTSLPVNLCDATLVIAAIACWHPGWRLGVELTYFWGLAGTLQAVLTPDLTVGFPHPAFLEFVVGHTGIIVAVGYLVVGLRRTPRPGAALRVLGITIAYTAAVAVIDVVTGGNYMYLARIPGRASLLSALGPWPWYIASAAGIAVALFVLLDAPFWWRRRRRAGSVYPSWSRRRVR